MIKTPKIIVSRDQEHWFDIFNAQEMLVFSGVMTNVEINEGKPQPLFYMRIAPDKDVADWTPSLAISLGATPKLAPGRG